MAKVELSPGAPRAAGRSRRRWNDRHVARPYQPRNRLLVDKGVAPLGRHRYFAAINPWLSDSHSTSSAGKVRSSPPSAHQFDVNGLDDFRAKAMSKHASGG